MPSPPDLEGAVGGACVVELAAGAPEGDGDTDMAEACVVASPVIAPEPANTSAKVEIAYAVSERASRTTIESSQRAAGSITDLRLGVVSLYGLDDGGVRSSKMGVQDGPERLTLCHTRLSSPLAPRWWRSSSARAVDRAVAAHTPRRRRLSLQPPIGCSERTRARAPLGGRSQPTRGR